MVSIVGTSVIHEPSDRCQGMHCHSCGLDESGHAWLWCLECGHGYECEADLVAAYRSHLLGTISRRSPWFRSNEWELSIAAILWRCLTIRADDIFFCPLCAHDF